MINLIYRLQTFNKKDILLSSPKNALRLLRSNSFLHQSLILHVLVLLATCVVVVVVVVVTVSGGTQSSTKPLVPPGGASGPRQEERRRIDNLLCLVAFAFAQLPQD